MNYRRQALVRQAFASRSLGRSRGTSTSDHAGRIIEVATLLSSFFLGVAAIALAFISLNVTREFNQWQKFYASKQEENQAERERSADADALKERCIGLAVFGVQLAKGHSASRAIEDLKTAQTFEPNCLRVGINLTALSAAIIVKNAPQFADALQQRAARIVKAGTPPRTQNGRTTDRFYLGSPQFRGFDIREVGPRVEHLPYKEADGIIADALGGRAGYLNDAELEIPLGSGAVELGLRPSIVIQTGKITGLQKPDDGKAQEQTVGNVVAF